MCCPDARAQKGAWQPDQQWSGCLFLSGRTLTVAALSPIYLRMSEEPNILEAAEAAKHSESEAQKAADARKRATYLKAGIGLGVGSAAIAAAILYASSGKKKKSDD